MKYILAICGIFLLSGCQSTETKQQITEVSAGVYDCRSQAISYMQTKMHGLPNIKDEKLALIYMMFMSQQKDMAFESCDDQMIALLNYHQGRFGKVADGAFRLGGIGLGLIGVDMIVDGVTDLANPGSNESYQIYNSRVVNRSGNYSTNSSISSSGEGLGLGNAISGRDAWQEGTIPAGGEVELFGTNEYGECSEQSRLLGRC